MSHEIFRYQLPGLIFLLPFLIFIIFFSLSLYPEEAIKIIVGAFAIFVGIHIPLGWFLYNTYRFIWIKWRYGYEKLPFLEMIRGKLNIFYAPNGIDKIIDLTSFLNELSLFYISVDEFKNIFNPFNRKKTFGEYKHRLLSNFPHFVEGFSDIFVFQNKSYDYARSIASVRYGIEISIFYFILSIILCSPLFYFSFIQRPLNSASEYGFNLYLYILLLGLALVILVLLIRRYRYAKGEYISRLCLITLFETKTGKLKLNDERLSLPRILSRAVEKIEDSIRKRHSNHDKIAVFDLDNTLISSDIGEAVFAQLKAEEIKYGYLSTNKNKIPLTWSGYQDKMKNEGKDEAYKEIVSAMKGIPLETVKDATYKVLMSKQKSVELEGSSIPLPVPNPIMSSLLLVLKLLHYKLYIISASNHYSVQIVAKELFGIPETNAFGIKAKFDDRQKNLKNILTSELKEPISTGKGKADVYRKYISSEDPLITVGDSDSDLSIFNLTSKNGISIFYSECEEEYSNIKKQAKYPNKILFLSLKSNLS